MVAAVRARGVQMPRHLNPRLAKIHRSYTVEDIARTWGLHRNTVRQWLKQGLPTIDQKRPLLILGTALAEFIEAKRRSRRTSLVPGELYCVRCHAARQPLGNIANFVPLSVATGNLVGQCPDCARSMCRRVNRARIDEVRGGLTITVADAPPHLIDNP